LERGPGRAGRNRIPGGRLTTGQDYVEGWKCPDGRLLFPEKGMHGWMAWLSVRGSLFSQDRHTASALHRWERPLPWDRAARGEWLVRFAYVVAQSDNQEPGYGPRGAGRTWGGE